MEDVSLDTQPAEVTSEGNTDVCLASGWQTYRGDDNPARVEQATGFCRIELCRCHGSLFRQVVNCIDISARSSPEGRLCRQIGGAGLG